MISKVLLGLALLVLAIGSSLVNLVTLIQLLSGDVSVSKTTKIASKCVIDREKSCSVIRQLLNANDAHLLRGKGQLTL